MSRKSLRRTALKNSPLGVTPLSNKKSNTKASWFESQPNDLSPSTCSNHTPIVLNLGIKESNAKTPLRKSVKMISEVSMSGTRRSKKSLISIADLGSSAPKEGETAGEKSTMNSTRKKRSYASFELEFPTRMKRTKKIRGLSFLPPVDMIDEDRHSPLSSESCATETDNKENLTDTEQDMEHSLGRSRTKRTTLFKKGDDRVLLSAKKKSRNPLLSTSDASFNVSEASEIDNEEKIVRNLFRRKKSDDFETKRSKKANKKTRFQAFLPPVDMIDEDKNSRSSLSSDNFTTDSSQKGNDTDIEQDNKLSNRESGIKKDILEKKNNEVEMFVGNSKANSENNTEDSDGKNDTDPEETIKTRFDRPRKAKRSSEKVEMFVGNNKANTEKDTDPKETIKTRLDSSRKAKRSSAKIEMIDRNSKENTENSDRKNDTDSEETIKTRRGRSRKARTSSTKIGIIDGNKVNTENDTEDSDRKNDTDPEETIKMRSDKSKKAKRSSGKLTSEIQNEKEILQDNTVGTSLLENVAASKTPKFKREGTFEIICKSPHKILCVQLTRLPDFEDIVSTRETYDIVPAPKNKNVSMETIDLTESVTESGPSPRKNLNRSTFQKNLDNRKSSFEVSFNFNKAKHLPDELLDNLNITRRDSRKKSFKKSSTARKYSTGSEEDTGDNFVTVRRGRAYNTMIDFDTGSSFSEVANERPISSGTFKLLDKPDEQESAANSAHMIQIEGPVQSASPLVNLANKSSGCGVIRKDSLIIKDLQVAQSPKIEERKSTRKRWSQSLADISSAFKKKSPVDSVLGKSFSGSTKSSKKPSPKKSILKKSVGRFTRGSGNDTFEIVDAYFQSIEGASTQSFTATPQTIEDTPVNIGESGAYRDIFDVVSNTPTVELDPMMLGSGESVLLANSFASRMSKASIAPKVTRSHMMAENQGSPLSRQTAQRQSMRKRWAQTEKPPTPMIDKMSPAQRNDSEIDTTTKSVTFGSSPRKLNLNKNGDNVAKGKKCVQIESPLSTPKIRLHSPLVVRKTPKPTGYKVVDDSIIAGNSALAISPYISPPSSSSTPLAKKKDISLLKKVLTAEKSVLDKSDKNSSRVKMPNFRKIHEKQFEKMENIKEMQERKARRAQYLMSGNKPPANVSASRYSEKESKKKLLFTPTKTESICLDQKNTSKSSVKKISKPVQRMLNRRASLEKKKKELKSKVPVLITRLTPLKKEKLATEPQPGGSKILSKLPLHLLSKKTPIEKQKPVKKPEAKVNTRRELKLSTSERLKKQDIVKAVSTKSKLAMPVNITAQNRKQVTAVRTNRRFELLMKMRANQK